jgi:hypothetical protein
MFGKKGRYSSTFFNKSAICFIFSETCPAYFNFVELTAEGAMFLAGLGSGRLFLKLRIQ